MRELRFRPRWNASHAETATAKTAITESKTGVIINPTCKRLGAYLTIARLEYERRVKNTKIG